MSETRIQTLFMNWCRKIAKFEDARFELIHHIPNGGNRNAREGHKFKMMGVVAGIPDICVPIPTPTCPGLYIEFKTDTGRLSEKQERIIWLLEKQGYTVLLCRTPMEAKKGVEDYLDLQLPDYGLVAKGA